MRNVTVTVATTPTPSDQFPGQSWGGITISLGATIPEQKITAPAYSAMFADVPAGTYTMTAQAIDTAGNPMGPAVTGECIVTDLAALVVNIDMPAGISFILS